jgi:hypothetical protein
MSPSAATFLAASAAFSTSPPKPAPFLHQKQMPADAPALGVFSMSPLADAPVSLLNFPDPAASPPDLDALPSILIRKLPRATSIDVVRTMLLFSKDMVDAEIVESDRADDHAHATVVARFLTVTAAADARDKLDGKQMANDARLVVELHGAPLPRNRSNVETALRPGHGSSTSLASAGGARQSSRYNGTFHQLDMMSQPSMGDMLPTPESNAPIQSLFSPQSPLANSAKSSKFMINDDPTDETGKLLNEAVPFAPVGDPARRMAAGAQLPIARLAGLSLSTQAAVAAANSSLVSPPMSALVSPRVLAAQAAANAAQSPSANGISPNGMSNGMSPLLNLGSNGSYPLSGPPPPQQQQQHFHPQRSNYPPANPADQNPPCNTLYVGNLPMDTSEEELKALFQKQRGYKRLCFRTKSNGPMCFVEFEDTSFATKALNELYGHPLHNSVKGGIRLSFSKNPLGVRSQQNANNHAAASMALHAAAATSMASLGNGGAVGGGGGGGSVSTSGAPQGFSTATGPPPGLVPPPGTSGGGGFAGLSMSTSSSGLGLYNGFNGGVFGAPLRQQQLVTPSSMAGAGGYHGMGDYHYVAR